MGMDAESFKKRFLPFHIKLYRIAFALLESNQNAEELKKDFTKQINDQYEELMRVKDDDTRTIFYAKKRGAIITELLMLGNTSGEFIVIQLLGNFTLKDIQDITNQESK